MFMRWCAVMVWLAIAITLSSQTGEHTGVLSWRIAKFLGTLLNIAEISMPIFHMGLRKIAHIIVFFILTFLSCNASMKTFVPIRSANNWSMVVCITISILDEWRKSIIPGRHCSWDEAGLNIIGCILGAALAWLVHRTIK